MSFVCDEILTGQNVHICGSGGLGPREHSLCGVSSTPLPLLPASPRAIILVSGLLAQEADSPCPGAPPTPPAWGKTRTSFPLIPPTLAHLTSFPSWESLCHWGHICIPILGLVLSLCPDSCLPKGPCLSPAHPSAGPRLPASLAPRLLPLCGPGTWGVCLSFHSDPIPRAQWKLACHI